MMNIFNYQALGILAAILIVIGVIPRYWTMLKTKDVAGISKKRLFLLVIGSVLWIMYGFRDSSPAIVLLATFCLSITCILFAIKLRSTTES
jgi:uncharacterized protein with PQ loop repeat